MIKVVNCVKEMRRAVITGATGAIGTALIKELINAGVEVLVLTRADSKRNANIPEHPLVRKKYCSLDQLSEVENDTGKTYDVFYHFAWAGASGPGRNDMYMQNNNVKYALDAVRAAVKFGCHTFIGAGSQAEYGRAEGALRADTPAFPEMGYGYGKLCAGLMTRDYAAQKGLRHIWVRILSVYGPNDGGQSLVMSVINTLREGGIPQCTKGEQQWDYLYSGDAARAFRLIGEKGIDGKTYVLGRGEVRLLADYIKDIRDVVRPEGELALGAIPYNNKQVMYLCADVSELKADTGWSADMDFKDGIKTIIESLN